MRAGDVKSGSFSGKEVTIRGWVHRLRKQKERAFILLRDDRGQRRAVDWATALDIFCRRMKSIQARFGKESVAFLGTGQIATEEMAFLGSLAKFGMGMVHGDGNTRQCMATAVVAYKQSFGFDAPPYTYADFEQSDVIVLVGSNLCIAHPIMWQRICRNTHEPQIIVIDPRKTETAMAATMHVPLAPKSDLAFFYGLANLLIREGWIDREFIEAHTADFAEFARHVAEFTPQRVAAATGALRAILSDSVRWDISADYVSNSNANLPNFYDVANDRRISFTPLRTDTPLGTAWSPRVWPTFRSATRPTAGRSAPTSRSRPARRRSTSSPATGTCVRNI